MEVGKVKIEKYTESVGPAPDGKQERKLAVTFRVGTHGPFTELFPISPVDPNAINTRLANFAQALGAINSDG